MNEELYIDKIFNEDFELWDIEKNIKFDNCIFKWGFVFNECILKNIKKVDFTNCIFENNFSFSDRLNENIIEYMNFKNCKFLWFFDIDSIKVKNLSFYNSSNLTTSLNCEFNWITTFRDIIYENLTFLWITINNILSFYWNKLLNNTKWEIKFNNLIWNWQVYIDKKNEINDLLFSYIKNFNSIKIQVNKINKFEFLDILDLKELSIWAIKKKENIKYIMLWRIFNKEEKWFFDFYNIEIDYIEFMQSPQIPDDFTFSDVIFKKANFSNINLWKTIFNWVEIKKLYLENTNLNDCIFNWVDFPDNYELLKKKLSYKKMKDNYRQLKFVMEKNWNKTEANKFFEKEMEYYMKSLSIKKWWFRKIFKSLYNKGFVWKDAKKIWEKITLAFWYTISEFWNNWLKPLQLLFFISISATIFDAVSTSLWIEKVPYTNIVLWNFYWDLIFILWIVFTFIILLFTTSKEKWFFEKSIEKFTWNLLITFSLTFFLFLFFSLKIDNFSAFKVFFNLLNPLYFKENWIEYNSIEIFWLVLYKTIYWILFWHLIVALKRITKR